LMLCALSACELSVRRAIGGNVSRPSSLGPMVDSGRVRRVLDQGRSARLRPPQLVGPVAAICDRCGKPPAWAASISALIISLHGVGEVP
jgi:hypothetical protein